MGTMWGRRWIAGATVVALLGTMAACTDDASDGGVATTATAGAPTTSEAPGSGSTSRSTSFEPPEGRLAEIEAAGLTFDEAD